MKLYCDNYLLEFSDIYLYTDFENDNNEIFQYLFNISNTPNISKKYLVDINISSFKYFINSCLIYNNEELSKEEFDTRIIQLLSKYNKTNSFELNITLNKKLGNLIINNIKYKNIIKYKKLHELFFDYRNYQIKYLLILINNLIKITKIENINNNYNMLDFVYDYYINK